jgi:hypothetical protein
MVAPASASTQDLLHSALLAASPAADLGLAVSQGQGLVTISTQVNLTASSKSTSGTQTTPTAGLAIASLNIATTGYYKIQVVVGFGGTAETTAVDNMQLKVNGAVAGSMSVINAVNTQSQTYEFYTNVTSASPAITVNAISAASAGAIYKATIIATRAA